MIFDQINQRVADMKHLHEREERKANREQQAKVDARYHDLAAQLMKLSTAVRYARASLDFPLSEGLQDSLRTLVDNLRSAVHSGYADQIIVTRETERCRSVQATLKREWERYFKTYTAATLSTLCIIRDIDAARVDTCTKEIEAAKVWTVELTVLTQLKDAKENAEQLIQDLGMDEEIVDFLMQMNGGQATLADLSEGVRHWIEKENLVGKIRLSF